MWQRSYSVQSLVMTWPVFSGVCVSKLRARNVGQYALLFVALLSMHSQLILYVHQASQRAERQLNLQFQITNVSTLCTPGGINGGAPSEPYPYLGLQVRLAVSPTFMEATPTCSLSDDRGFTFEKNGFTANVYSSTPKTPDRRTYGCGYH
jgi:hypothetical protein